MDKAFMDRTFKAPDGSVWARVLGGTMLHDGRHVVGIELFDDTEGVSLMVDPREALELANAILDAAAVGEADAA
jgi:hypothetical protein